MNDKVFTFLNQYLSNLAVMYVKLHNLHWNVVGPDFKQVHEYLETLYDEIADTLDSVAEQLKTHGGQPLASLKEYLSAATIQELPSEELRSGEALAVVQNDLSVLIKQGEQIRVEAHNAGLYDVVSSMEEQLAAYQKSAWFIRAMRK